MAVIVALTVQTSVCTILVYDGMSHKCMPCRYQTAGGDNQTSRLEINLCPAGFIFQF